MDVIDLGHGCYWGGSANRELLASAKVGFVLTFVRLDKLLLGLLWHDLPLIDAVYPRMAPHL